jgi:hypothetical protein
VQNFLENRGQYSRMAKRKRSSKEQPNGEKVKRKQQKLQLSDLPMVRDVKL